MPDDRPPKTDFTIDANLVKHVANLIRLGIAEEQAQAFSHQFSDIIDYFHLLNEVDTQEVTPASEASSTRSVMRPDEVLPSMPREDFFKNVPHRDGAYVKVPQVFEQE